MNKKMWKIVGVLLIICILGVLLFINTKRINPKIDGNSKCLVIGKQNLIAIYENKLAVAIPYEVYMDKNTTFGDLVGEKNGEEVLNTINKILPKKLDTYVVIKYGQQKLNVKNEKNIPETVIDNKRYVLTSSLYNMFDTLYSDRNIANELNENIIVDVLNANGRTGYARKTGEDIKKVLGMKYNAANYETILDESYIIINDIAIEKAQDIVMQLNEKYLKIQQTPTVPTLANVVVVLGKEQNPAYTIEIIGDNKNSEETVAILKKEGYKNVKKTAENIILKKSVIEYAPSDYFIAYKIAKKLGVEVMIENEQLKDKIQVKIMGKTK